MKFKISYFCKGNKACTRFDLDPVCVYLSIHVNMGLTLSALRIRFYFYCLVARNIPSSDSAPLTETFCNLPGSSLDKLKGLHSEVFTKIHWGRLLVFLNFVKQLGLTDEIKWEQLDSIFSFPLLPKCKNRSYIRECSRKKSQSSVDLRSCH